MPCVGILGPGKLPCCEGRKESRGEGLRAIVQNNRLCFYCVKSNQ
jgi:hypothetical protein